MKTQRINTGLVHVPVRLRAHVDPERVQSLADSMNSIGLMTPITVWYGEHEADGKIYDAPILVAGHHRLEAAKKLGWGFIDAIVTDAEETTRRMWEISENLHRSELTELERGEHIEEWRKLAAEKGAQLAHPSGGKQPHAKGVSAVARELGLSRRDVRRSEKIAAIAPEAKEAARAARLDDNQSALLKVAATPREEQVQEVQRLASTRAHGPGGGTPTSQFEGLARFLERLGKLGADTVQIPTLDSEGVLVLLDDIKAAEATLRKLRARIEALP